MESKTLVEKLRILLPHWVAHNQNHEAEFRQWAASARMEGSENLAALLDKAAENMAATDKLLKKAEIEAGGTAEAHAHHHDH